MLCPLWRLGEVVLLQSAWLAYCGWIEVENLIACLKEYYSVIWTIVFLTGNSILAIAPQPRTAFVRIQRFQETLHTEDQATSLKAHRIAIKAHQGQLDQRS